MGDLRPVTGSARQACVCPRAEAKRRSDGLMVSERLTFSRRILLLVGALVVVRAVNGCAAAPPDSAPPAKVAVAR